MNVSTIPTQQENKEIGELISKGKYEDAIPKLKSLMNESSDKEKLHNALAWCYYGISNYKEALIHIEMSLELNPQSLNSRSIKGCILAEHGIETKSKTKLLSAKEIFSEIVGVRKNWSSFYNLANTLSALGEYEEAKKMYIKSLKENNKAAETWKNLGSCYFHLGNHKKELVCMDVALSINPRLSEALISKGVTLGVIFKNYIKALNLINSVLENDKKICYRWPTIYYWKAKFLSDLSEKEKALNELEEGLKISPDSIHLLNLKAQILSQLWRIDKDYLAKASDFFEFRTRINEEDLASIRELVLIYRALEKNDKSLSYALELIN